MLHLAQDRDDGDQDAGVLEHREGRAVQPVRVHGVALQRLGELDGLQAGAERPREEALDGPLEALFEVPQDAHGRVADLLSLSCVAAVRV